MRWSRVPALIDPPNPAWTSEGERIEKIGRRYFVMMESPAGDWWEYPVFDRLKDAKRWVEEGFEDLDERAPVGTHQGHKDPESRSGGAS